MTRSGIAAAGWLEKAELAAVWEKCFGDPPRHIHYFFNNLFEPQNCLTYREDGGIVSMVHMLPARIADGGRLVQAHYIYAAATLPEYRSRGLMGQLLEAAFQAGRRRGDRYSFLLPANRSLYRFYGNLGYTVGFELRTLAVSREEMQQAAAGGLAVPAGLRKALRFPSGMAVRAGRLCALGRAQACVRGRHQPSGRRKADLLDGGGQARLCAVPSGCGGRSLRGSGTCGGSRNVRGPCRESRRCHRRAAVFPAPPRGWTAVCGPWAARGLRHDPLPCGGHGSPCGKIALFGPDARLSCVKMSRENVSPEKGRNI